MMLPIFMMKIQWSLLIASMFVAGLFTPAVTAGTIAATPAPVASGPGLGLVVVPAIVTANSNNDNQIGTGGANDNNLVIPLKRFDVNDYIDIVFTINPSEGVTEYKVTEFVDNNTGVNWSAYTIQLGFGTGNAFSLSPVGDGLDFDFPTFDAPPTSGSFTLVGLNSDQLTFTNGSQGTGAQPFTFRLDIPDLNLAGPTTFTLRQIPTPVPEPTAAVLLGLGGLFVPIMMRRRS
jgi:hypothetical protein